MQERLYVCNICKHRFSRKSNAFRHNSTIHHDLATIVRNSVQPHKDNTRGKNYVRKDLKTKRFSQYVVQKENDPLSVDYYEDTLFDSGDAKIDKILGQLIKPYLALEKELENMNPRDKLMILSNSFVSSLDSYNPVKSLTDIAELYRSTRALDIIAKNLSVSTGLHMAEAVENVKESARNCSLYQRINN